MQIISVMNYNGGVGKTTVTANLAGELAFRGKKQKQMCYLLAQIIRKNRSSGINCWEDR